MRGCTFTCPCAEAQAEPKECQCALADGLRASHSRPVGDRRSSARIGPHVDTCICLDAARLWRFLSFLTRSSKMPGLASRLAPDEPKKRAAARQAARTDQGDAERCREFTLPQGTDHEPKSRLGSEHRSRQDRHAFCMPELGQGAPQKPTCSDRERVSDDRDHPGRNGRDEKFTQIAYDE